MKSGISLCILAKNEEEYIHNPIMSVKNFANEIVVIDDNSSDKTALVAQGLGARIVKNQVLPKKYGFSKVYNWAISNMEYEWVLILDADELLTDAHLLQVLTRYQDKEAWNLPRRKWEDFSKGIREEYEAYPDWQPRFFKRKEDVKFVGECHKDFICDRLYNAYRGPHIEHLQKELSTPEKELYRKDLYEHLARKQGVWVERGHAKTKENK